MVAEHDSPVQSIYMDINYINNNVVSCDIVCIIFFVKLSCLESSSDAFFTSLDLVPVSIWSGLVLVTEFISRQDA